MKIILASTNQGKIRELKALLPDFEIITAKEILGDIDVEEDGKSFQENAFKKAKTIYDMVKLQESDCLVIADDSGLSVPELDNEPNIYSARYAGVGASDKENNEKLITKLKSKNLEITPAFYTACIAIAYKENIYTTHGWLYGDVIDKSIGDGGFGYDPLFIPKGYSETLGTLDPTIKKQISHRTKALLLAMKIVKVIL
ncbi:MAG: non-canonical purine NTP pyrophosphatase [Arcobacteraceae bacterium]|jgi:XTP/dITP diphosphohydrolase|nr:non-canonical purine NTP pyrophosphatase [Arcobacteraceae bacterium]